MPSVTVVISWTAIKLLGLVLLILHVLCFYGMRKSTDRRTEYLFYVSKLIVRTLFVLWALVFFFRGLFLAG